MKLLRPLSRAPRAVDLFCGLGGFSEGAEQAGFQVLAAANHWKEAVALHERNHPLTMHLCQDLNQIDPRVIPAHDVLLASPACQGHSRARGAEKEHHDALRSTAWAVVTVLECKRSDAFIVENVPEFLEWKLFPMWKASLEALGYVLNIMVLNAADFGVPQSRERMFVVGGRGRRIEIENPRLAHVPARNLIQWGKGNWVPNSAEERLAAGMKPFVELVTRQLENGRARYGEQFLVAYYSSEQYGRSLERPIGTITTNEHFRVVDGDRSRMLLLDENRAAMGFPTTYQLPKNKAIAQKMLGNAVPPGMARGLLVQVREQLFSKQELSA